MSVPGGSVEYMTTSTASVTSAPAAVLAAARRHRAEAEAAEVRVLQDALSWAMLHVTDDDQRAAQWGEVPVPLAGDGAPMVSEFCVTELAAVLGLSSASGRDLVAHALELGHRLPRLWRRVCRGQVAAWWARRVADATLRLSAEAAAFVDAQVAPFAHRVSLGQLERLVAEAIARFMPEEACRRRELAADGRYFTVEHGQVSFAGTSRVEAELDLADALDLDAAVAAGAEQLSTLGSTESLDVRRAKAAGELARRQLALDLQAGFESEDRPARPPRREMVLYVHLSQDAVTGRVENRGPHLITPGTIREWLGVRGTKVTVRPVVDLAAERSTNTYRIPDDVRERVVLRDPTCVFPWCTHPSRRLDLDHVVPYSHDGPGQTSTSNLAPLCRHHHRAKTHGGWGYRVIAPGQYEWVSPHGYRYRTDAGGTTCLTPAPIAPSHSGERPPR